MARDDSKKPPLRQKKRRPETKKTIFSGKVETNSLSEFFIKIITQHGITEDDNWPEVLDKTGFEKTDLQKVIDYLGNFFGLIQKDDETLGEFLERAVSYLHYHYPHEGEVITEANVPANLEELVADFEAHQKEIDDIKAKVHLKNQEVVALLERLQKDIALFSAQSPKNLRIPPSRQITIAKEVVVEQTETVRKIGQSIRIDLSPEAVNQISNSSITAEKTSEFEAVLKGLGVKPTKIPTVLDQIAENKRVLLGKAVAVEGVRREVLDKGIDDQEVEITAKKIVSRKKDLIEKEIETHIPRLDRQSKAKIIAASLVDDYHQVEKELDKANVPVSKKQKVVNQIAIENSDLAAQTVIAAVTGSLPEDINQPKATNTARLLKLQTDKVREITNQAEIDLPEKTIAKMGALATGLPSLDKPETETTAKKVDEFKQLLASLGEKPPETDTILTQLSQNRKILFRQIQAEETIKQELVDNNLPTGQAEKIAINTVKTKRSSIEEKIAQLLPEAGEKTTTEIVTSALSDDFKAVSQALGQIPNLSEIDQTALFEEIAVTNKFLAAQATVANLINNLPDEVGATVPESFQAKLREHPEVVNHIAGLIVNQTAKGASQEDILPSVIVPSTIAITNSDISIEKGEEKALKQVLINIPNSTLEMVTLREDEYFQTSILVELEKQIQTYLGKNILISQPDGKAKYLDLDDKVNARAARMMAEFMVVKPNSTQEEFLNQSEAQLGTLPAENPVEALAQLNTDQDPLMAASIAAKMAEIPPDQLQEQIIAWRSFYSNIEKLGQPIVITDNQLLNKIPSLEEKENLLIWKDILPNLHQLSQKDEISNDDFRELAPGLKDTEHFSAWINFIDYFKKADKSKLFAKDKLITVFESWYGEKGVAEYVYNSQLYHVYHNVKQVFSPVINLYQQHIQPRVKKFLAETAIGQSIKAALDKGKDYLKEKIIDPVKKWVFEKIAQKLAEKGVEVAVNEGATAAIAAILGVPSFGVSVALWLLWEGIKIGYNTIKAGLEKIGIDPVTISEKINRTFGFGVAPRVNKAIDKLLFFIPGMFRDFIKFIFNLWEPIFYAGVGGLVIAGLTIAIGIPIFFQIIPRGLINTTMAPPIGRGGQGVPMDQPGLGDIEVADINKDQCLNLSGSAQRACIVTLVIEACSTTQGAVTSSNVNTVRDCFQEAMADDSDINSILSGHVDHIVNAFTTSTNSYHYLQCVGYKIAVEPALPGCGDAKRYYNDGCGNCDPVPVSSIQIGDNAVWTTGAYGHIAIVINVDDNYVYLSQAWGGSGTINFTRLPKTDPTGYIRCQ
jgi:hypothetical protein